MWQILNITPGLSFYISIERRRSTGAGMVISLEYIGIQYLNLKINLLNFIEINIKIFIYRLWTIIEINMKICRDLGKNN